MRVVHLTTEFPWPATSGGPVRTVSQLRVIASLPEVDAITIVSVAERDVDDAEMEALAAAVPKLRVVRPVFHPIHLWQFPAYVPRVVVLRALGVPYLAGKWHSPPLRRTLHRELAQTGADVVYVDHLGMLTNANQVIGDRARARTVLDQHNVESDFFGQFAAQKRGPKKLVAVAEHRVARRYEQRALRSVDAVVAISNEDASRFATLAGIRAHVVPVVMPLMPNARSHVEQPHFCYVGNLRWHPNVAGLDWFCRDVWPLVRRRFPEATLVIAGVGLPTEHGRPIVPEEWRVPGVETVGYLEDLEPLYVRSLAMLAPVFGGSGVRLKLLEGFRAGMPLITTPDGVSGLPVADGKELLVGATARAFADRVARIVDDRALRARLRAQGYAYLERRHSLAAAQGAMRAALGL
jgi:glycosyltransferase involved in cell wall biosynthesis